MIVLAYIAGILTVYAAEALYYWLGYRYASYRVKPPKNGGEPRPFVLPSYLNGYDHGEGPTK